MSDKIKNAKQHAQVWYGLHMVEGVAEYPEHKGADGKPTRILVLENALKEMNPSFAGKPVYVRHVEQVDLSTLQEDADGYVIESFFNQVDGKHWAKFIIVSDEGHKAIQQGWRLSNAYTIKDARGAGHWHAVDYSREVSKAVYDHLAIVPNPRYEESILLTPEQFKTYNSKKELELTALKNSREQKPSAEKNLKGDRSMWNFLKKTKVDNSDEIAGTTVTLSNGQELTVGQLINEKEEAIKSKDEDAGEKKNKRANGNDMVEVGDKKENMTVNELIAKYNALCAPKNAEDDEKKKKEADEKKNAEDKAKKDEDEKKNAEEKAKKEADEKKANGMAEFLKLQNAGPIRENEAEKVLDTSVEQLARGRERYGSAKK